VNVVIQEEKTGCGIASVANIVNLPYTNVKKKANSLGIFAEDKTLYSDTGYVRRLLNEYKVETSNKEVPFTSWDKLPDLALLSIKYHEEEGVPFWHWVVFKRINGNPVVLDSASYLNENKRLDFDVMEPKWYIEAVKT
jgi:ABC-type bacteriocin/lantibiotic exporter with double-glycine peptidase domain